jgi:hypothetical protein
MYWKGSLRAMISSKGDSMYAAIIIALVITNIIFVSANNRNFNLRMEAEAERDRLWGECMLHRVSAAMPELQPPPEEEWGPPASIN